MPIELKVPEVGESITEVHIANWHISPGDYVAIDEDVVELETDKATVNVPAPVGGILKDILKPAGQTAAVGEVIATLEEADAPPKTSESSSGQTAARDKDGQQATPVPAQATATALTPSSSPATVMPAAARLLAEHGLSAEQVPSTGPGGRLLKEDVERFIASRSPASGHAGGGGHGLSPRQTPTAIPARSGDRTEKSAIMSPIRKRIAERLVAAQNNAALLTTFNEVNMAPVMALRKQYQDAFTKRYDVKLGFMSFFVKAVIDALNEIPQVGAQIRGDELVYQNYCDIGIAIGGGKGLVVPIIRNAELLSFAEIELKINELGRRARENKIGLDELQGGTFTITNGGIYGSLLSTPIVNPPQSGVLGMHNIVQRPVAENGQVVIRPMMYLALTYDHRAVDGREAVTFLKRITEAIEDPTRMLIEV